MKKKGFTLVELLAVILILAVVSVITYAVVTKIIENSRQKAASEGAKSFLGEVENYTMMHSINSSKYPLKLEPNTTYNIEDIKDYIKMKGDMPTSGSITLDEKGKIKEADLIVNGYTVTCTDSTTCETVLEPKVYIIISDTWETNKNVEILVTTPKSALDKKPYSFDGGKSWTKDETKTFEGNQKLDILVKDKAGKEYGEFIVCTSKKNGKPENCTTKKTNEIYISKADPVAPTCELLISGEEGKENWYKSDINISMINVEDTGKDVDGKTSVGSGIKSQNLNISKITEDGSYNVVGTVIDNAGNVGTCKKTLGRDTKVPTLTSKMTGTTYSDGYMKGSTLEVTCTDDGSGVDEKSPNQTFDTYGNKSVTLTCKDKAGNTSTETKTYRIYESYSCSVACGSYSCSVACGTESCNAQCPRSGSLGANGPYCSYCDEWSTYSSGKEYCASFHWEAMVWDTCTKYCDSTCTSWCSSTCYR